VGRKERKKERKRKIKSILLGGRNKKKKGRRSRLGLVGGWGAQAIYIYRGCSRF
jgi:hypothetical protein